MRDVVENMEAGFEARNELTPAGWKCVGCGAVIPEGEEVAASASPYSDVICHDCAMQIPAYRAFFGYDVEKGRAS